jgi:hemerythrin-like domain-containing protein
MKPLQSNPEARNLRRLLMHEHAQLDETFQALLNAFDADARVECAQLWSEFDTRLRAHMLLEEQSMLPAFAREHPAEAERIRAEHRQIQQTLIDLGIGVDLHLARADLVEGFVALLRSHAASEDELFYEWSQEHLGPEERSTVLDRLLTRLQHLPAQDAATR